MLINSSIVWLKKEKRYILANKNIISNLLVDFNCFFESIEKSVVNSNKKKARS